MGGRIIRSGDCVLRGDCVRGLERGREGKGVGELCVERRLCEGD